MSTAAAVSSINRRVTSSIGQSNFALSLRACNGLPVDISVIAGVGAHGQEAIRDHRADATPAAATTATVATDQGANAWPARPRFVKTRGMSIAKRAGFCKAVVAVARKLAVIMQAMWIDGTVYCGDPAVCAADAPRRPRATTQVVGAQTARKVIKS